MVRYLVYRRAHARGEQLMAVIADEYKAAPHTLAASSCALASSLPLLSADGGFLRLPCLRPRSYRPEAPECFYQEPLIIMRRCMSSGICGTPSWPVRSQIGDTSRNYTAEPMRRRSVLREIRFEKWSEELIYWAAALDFYQAKPFQDGL